MTLTLNHAAAPMEANSSAMLSMRNLSVSFLGARGRWSRVVNDLSFDIAAGETVALVGESGSGKSVTSLSIMRLLDPATSRLEGEIILDGKDVLKLDEAQMIREMDASVVSRSSFSANVPAASTRTQDLIPAFDAGTRQLVAQMTNWGLQASGVNPASCR